MTLAALCLLVAACAICCAVGAAYGFDAGRKRPMGFEPNPRPRFRPVAYVSNSERARLTRGQTAMVLPAQLRDDDTGTLYVKET